MNESVKIPFITQKENNLRQFVSKCCQKPLEVMVYGDEGLVDEEMAFCEKCNKGYHLQRDVDKFLWIEDEDHQDWIKFKEIHHRGKFEQ